MLDAGFSILDSTEPIIKFSESQISIIQYPASSIQYLLHIKDTLLTNRRVTFQLVSSEMA
jgi:hypothetical protein